MAAPFSGSLTATLTSYAPDYVSLTSGNPVALDMTVDPAEYWAFVSFAITDLTPRAFTISCVNISAVLTGLIVTVSSTDVTAVTWDAIYFFETFNELAIDGNGSQFGIFKGSSNTPPVSPNSGDAWAITTGGTGAWVGSDNTFAIWDGYSNSWVFITPRVGSYMTASSTVFALWTQGGWVNTFGATIWQFIYTPTNASGGVLTASITSQFTPRGSAGHINLTIT